MDKRKNNGNKGHSTKSVKAFDRRKRISISDNDSFNMFFDRMKEDMMVFYESTYKGFLDKHIKHGEYYVYFHYLNEEIVYIGKGSNKEHSELLKAGLISEVLIANNLVNDIALLIESSLISKLKPIYNDR